MTACKYFTVLAAAAVLCLPVPGPAMSATGSQAGADTTAPLTVPPATGAAQTPAAAPQPATPLTPSPTPATPPATATTPAPGDAGPAQPGTPEDAGEDEGDVPLDEELSLGEIPVIETVELTPESAKRALDSYIAAREKYANSELDQYENLQDFVDQTDDGKAFEADVKAAGFANVTQWNLAIITLGLVYGSIIDDQSQELELQIKEVEDDKEMAQDIKDRMIKALKALIPSENNRKVVEGLLDDPVYREKLKLLDLEEE